jgi:hypothetical protein
VNIGLPPALPSLRTSLLPCLEWPLFADLDPLDHRRYCFLCWTSQALKLGRLLLPRWASRSAIASARVSPWLTRLTSSSTSVFLRHHAVLLAPDRRHLSPHVASKSLRAGPPRIPESHSLQTSSRVFTAYKTYTRGLEAVEASTPACIGAEEGMWATVSTIGRAEEEEEVFSAVEVARVGSKRSRGRGSRRRLVGSACT